MGGGGHALASVELEDSLGMDIQLLPPVVPEEVPEGEEGPAAVAAAQQRQTERRRLYAEHQQAVAAAGAAAAGIAAGERAFAAKIAGWEDELLGMLQTQVRVCGRVCGGWGRAHLLQRSQPPHLTPGRLQLSQPTLAPTDGADHDS